MKDANPQTIHLSDYKPFPYAIDGVELTFRLAPEATRVISRVRFVPQPGATGEMFLHGEDLELISASIDGRPVDPQVTPEGLTCAVPDKPFLWEAEVGIAPAKNTRLEGLYMSPQNVGAGGRETLQSPNAMYCTQCEAEGFRRITFYPDRPDVMAVFTVRIESDLPVLLSNGNPQEQGPGFATWHDPWPKPAYLFALVAGDLAAHRDTFTTRSGKHVDLAIWVRPGPDERKCAWAMDSLKRSMTWDERTYGREYDLDVFNIVAVDDFNMGAMENKGLNIFNSSAVLASPETATDANFERIEGIIAHEYFHNWTGNRITCRDWFQLCLKEGLTVFRDQQFTSDMRSAAVKRIDDVLMLRGRQFREDNGPLAHPVRPESFVEINNFYTATVYEKGAEVIGMLKRLVGDADYARALDLYFERHDGEAATIEDWLKVFEDTTGRDLGQFKRWYSDAGTPRLDVEEDWSDGTYTLTFTQSTPPTPGQPEKPPRVIPIAVGLLNPNGDEVVPTTVLEMTEGRQSFAFEGLAARPVPSILRGFSAPVILRREPEDDERAFLLAHDTDPFNRFEAGRGLAKSALTRMITDGAAPPSALLDAWARLAVDESLDPAYRALALGLPGQEDMAQTLSDAGITPDPRAIRDAAERLEQAQAERLRGDLAGLMASVEVTGPFSPDADQAGRRALWLSGLRLLSRLDEGKAAERAYASADNMTVELGALGCMFRAGRAGAALEDFYSRWKDDRLVIDKWFGLQAGLAPPDEAVGIVRGLTGHEAFDWKNPNRFRSVIGAFGMNPAGFHDPSGAGYQLVADWLIRVDPLNPQITARMCTLFETLRRYDADRQGLMREALERIAGTPGLSRDTAEMVGRILAG